MSLNEPKKLYLHDDLLYYDTEYMQVNTQFNYTHSLMRLPESAEYNYIATNHFTWTILLRTGYVRDCFAQPK